MKSDTSKSSKDKNLIFVGIDDGHSDVKVVLEDGSTRKFPTRIAFGAHAADFPGMETNVTVFEIVENSTKYTTHPFLHDEDCIDVRFDGYPESDMNLIMIQNALINSGLDSQNVVICSGLPVQNHYTPDGHINNVLVEAKNKNLSRQVRAGELQGATIVKSYVATEAIASFIDAIMDMDGKKSSLYEKLTSETVAVLDIGGKTTDFAVLHQGGRIVDKKRLGSFQNGILNLKDQIKNFIKTEFKLNSLGIKHIESALSQGTFKYGGTTYDVSSKVEEFKEIFVKNILQTLDRKLGDLGDVEYILCVGGGSALLKNNLINKYNGQAVVVDEPEFSNARGMFKIAKFIAKGK